MTGVNEFGLYETKADEKANKIDYLKSLLINMFDTNDDTMRKFYNHLSTELERKLMKDFGMTAEEIEAIEIEAIKEAA